MMIRLIKALVHTCWSANQQPDRRVRRRSLVFPEGQVTPAHCRHDTAKHRRHHHYYEDLLT